MLHVHTATDLRVLADRLGDVLSVAPADAFEQDIVVVPSSAMRTWLSLRLASRLGASGPGRSDGVCANVDFTFPGALRSRVMAVEAGESTDPWQVGPMTWAVLECAAGLDGMPPALADDPSGAPGAASSAGTAARYAAARQVADLFDRYHVHRPAMVRLWASGRDCDAALGPLPEHHRWQARLWRAVRHRLGVPSPAERDGALLDAIHDAAAAVDLPGRVCVFGFSVLPGGAEMLGLLDALGSTREVGLFLPQPCSHLAAVAGRATAEPVGAGGAGGAGRPREAVDPVVLFDNPLLRSWARPHLETAVLLRDGIAHGTAIEHHHVSDGATTPSGPPSLLGRLQGDLLADASPGGGHEVAAGDHSVQFHAAQGPTRQVEVLRDAICALLADDALDLCEDDILVVCGDLPAFAPLIEATWGEPARRSRPMVPPSNRVPALRYRIADRGMTSANAVALAATRLVEVGTGRFDAPTVVDLLASDPVRARMGLSDGDVATVAAWVADTRVRWGRDGAHRHEWGVSGDAGDPADAESNTWSAGIGRLMAGMAVATESGSPSIGGVPPLMVEGSSTTVLGRFAEALWRLGRLADDLVEPAPVSSWVERLSFHFGELLSAPADAPWQMERLRRVLGSIVDDVEAAGCDPILSPAELQRLLADRLDAQSGSANFFRGGVTVTSATPIRWIPHKVVCLLGMDQAVLGAGTPDGDDLLAAAPIVGDRDPAAESRQFLLEAVLSADSHLVVVRDGRDVRTNHPVPPAVALAELRAAVSAAVSGGVTDPAEADDPQEPVVSPQEVLHPRQAWSERCLRPGGLVRGTTWSFDPAARTAAVARRARSARFSFLAEEPLARPDDGVVQLDDLRRVLTKPIATFLTDIVDLRLPRSDDALEGVLPTGIDPLDRYAVATALASMLDSAGVAPDDEAATEEIVRRWMNRERRLGRVPVPGLSASEMKIHRQAVVDLRSAAAAAGYEPWVGPASEVVEVALEVDGTTLVGELECRLSGGRPGPADARMSTAKETDRIGAWLDLLVLHAVDPSRPWRSLTARRKSTRDATVKVTQVEIEPAAAALDELSIAVDLYHRARREPLPIFADLSKALVDGAADLAGKWPGMFPDTSETAVFGDLDVWDLLALPTLDRDGTPLDEHRVAHYAQRLWGSIHRSVRDIGVDDSDGEEAERDA